MSTMMRAAFEVAQVPVDQIKSPLVSTIVNVMKRQDRQASDRAKRKLSRKPRPVPQVREQG